ncbi:MAG: Ig-like domain-containing protein [Eubacteriales bacterium]|nr:Ig-like domain-containing protein [Eubacteriales bacterium]
MAQTPILAPAPAVVSVPLKKIIVTTKKISLQTKASRNLSVIKVPSNTTEALKYTSSKPKVVSVSSNGKLKAKKPGKAKITISGANTKQTITVTVSKQSMPTKKLSFKKKALKVKKGTVRFLPYKINAASNQKIIWKSSKKAVVSVDSNGKITAKKKGKAIITLKSGKKKTTCKITVK